MTVLPSESRRAFVETRRRGAEGMGLSDFILANGTWANEPNPSFILVPLILITLIIEVIVITAFVRKPKRQRIIGAVILANLLSFIAGLIIMGAAG